MGECRTPILIVDDDDEFLAYLGRMLASPELEIVSAQTIGAARRELSRKRFALILTDLRLPDGSGLDILHEARQESPLSVGIVLTAHSSVDSALEALREGAFDYLLKPLNPEILRAAARRGLEHYRLNLSLIEKTSEADHLRRQLEGKSQLLQNVSHELKNPLTVVNGYMDFLLRLKPEEHQPEGLRRNFQSIQKNAERMGAMLEDLSEGSRLAANKISLKTASIRAAAAVSEAVENIKLQATKKELSVRFEEGRSADLMLSADPGRLQQILSNLLVNAVKFTPEGGTITVTVVKDGPAARLSVRDTGIGIPEKNIPFLFERFYQAHDQESNHKGLGIGLDICRSLVELHGGRIWAQSEPGLGATFHFTIPLAAELTKTV